MALHVHNDYAIRQANHFRFRTRVADLQPSETGRKRLDGLFLQLFIQNPREVTQFEMGTAKIQA